MKFGLREIIFVIVMLGLLGSTNYFVFSKANKKKQDLLGEIRTKQAALSNFQQATAGIEDLNNKIAFQHVAFHVSAEEFIAAQIQLAALKVEVEGPEDTGVAYSIFVSDPDGHLLELTTYYGITDVPTIAARESCAPGSNGSTRSFR